MRRAGDMRRRSFLRGAIAGAGLLGFPRVVSRSAFAGAARGQSTPCRSGALFFMDSEAKKSGEGPAMYSYEEVISYVEEENVKFIRLAFCDAAGQQKRVKIGGVRAR